MLPGIPDGGDLMRAGRKGLQLGWLPLYGGTETLEELSIQPLPDIERTEPDLILIF